MYEISLNKSSLIFKVTNYHFLTEYLQNSELESYGQENNRGGWKPVWVSGSTFINENKNLKMTKILLILNANHNTTGRLPKMFDFKTQNKYQRH